MKHAAPPEEQGAALLSVLLLVAIVAVLAAASLEKLKLATHLAGNSSAIDQARAYAMSAETVSLYRIGDLLQRDTAKTTLEGNWANRDVNFPIDGGSASARLTDGGNCFNLNGMVQKQSENSYVVRPEAVTQFARLMALLEIPAADARRVSIATADWIDSDSVPQPGGAEDESYATATIPYRTGNTLMVDPSELRAVAGVTPALYTRVRPFLCALPMADMSQININTLLPAQAPLLAMMVPGLDSARAKAIIDARPAGGHSDLVKFWEQSDLRGTSDFSKQQLGLRSRWFGLHMLIELTGAELEENALIDAALQPAKLVRRSYGEAT
ncbi:general secretion pathway protein GspK [Sphingomonas paeninsulae]|uniref:Type II secretion system protein K n=1 Tax=Sphingomonas paeninsulae TaxID=2319844 RepID=A0A494TKN3_SPHPE|nr:type II secretion system minor pseudopilin GspK [Sphingomonas paeninsulae]AYJ85675.1 general secretion pathway protein GspK [Sphingomonas paeninsulae]